MSETRNEYRAQRRPQASNPPASPPAASPIPVGWSMVDECLWSGHRFVLLRNAEDGGHRIDVDGIEVWTTSDPDGEAAALELARRMAVVSYDAGADDDDIEVLEHESPSEPETRDQSMVRVDRRPLLDDWQRSPSAAAARARELGAELVYRLTYRLVHPLRTGRALAGLWLVGVWWLLRRWALWTFDHDEAARMAQAKALRAPDSGKGSAMDRTADKTPLEWRADHRLTVYRRLRGHLIILVAAAGCWTFGAVRAWQATAVWSWLWWSPSTWTTVAITAAVVLIPMIIGWLVRPSDAGPVLDRPITVRRVPDLRRNPGLILDGFEGLGGRRTADAYRRQREQGITACDWESEPLTTYAGDGKTPVGLLCKVRTPEPARIMLKSAKEPEAVVAQAIGRSADQVKLRYDEDDPANVVTVFVGLRQLKDMTDLAWPLASKRAQRGVNFFEPVPFGFDEYGQTLTVTLNGKHALIGGATDTGKSSGARAILAAALLDPRVRLYAYFKIGPDAHPFVPIGHRVRSGNDADDVRTLVTDLEEIIVEAKRRGDFQARHPELFPEGSVTEAAWQSIAADSELQAELGPSGLDPIVVYIDECRFFFLDPEVGPLLEWICAQARSLGITVILATQYPDKHAAPTSIKSNLLFRACLLVKGEAGQRVVLGEGVAARAYVPRILPKKGMCFVTAPEWAARGAVRARFFWLPLPDCRSVMEQAAEHRRRRGQLTGSAAGELPPDPSQDTVLDHVAALPGGFGERIHGQDLAVLLGEHHAGYVNLDGARVLAMLRDHDVPTGQVETEVRFGADRGQRRNRQGLHRRDFDVAYADHLAARDNAEAASRTLPTVAQAPVTDPDIAWEDPDTRAAHVVDGPDNWADTDGDIGPYNRGDSGRGTWVGNGGRRPDHRRHTNDWESDR